MATYYDAIVDAALAYAARGWHILPCRPRDKVPLVEHGVHDATATADTIRAWWHQWPSANIGIACGPSGLLVVDIDDPDAAREALTGYSPLPGTPVARTSKGYHYYFRTVEGARNGVRVLPGVDVRADGGYVVAPPSVHPSGAAYRWLRGRSPDEVPVAPCPAWLADLLSAPRSRGRAPGDRSPPHEAVEAGPIEAGRRNDTLARIAGRLRARGYDRDAILAELVALNRTRCVPPLPDDEVARIAESIARYPAPDAPMSPRDIEALATEIAALPAEDRVRRIRAEVLPAVAALDPLAAGPALKAAAKALDVPVGDLRREVSRLREALHSASDSPPAAITALWPEVTPSPDPVPLAEVLDAVAAYLRRFAVLPPYAADTLALWTLMTYTVEVWDRIPLILLTSPAPRSGKSTVMELLARVVARPLSTVSISPAALYRVVEAAHPTLLLDEADSTLADNPDLTALINSAHARESARVVRVHPETLAIETYNCFTPIAIAGNNVRLAPATRDRCITIAMRRKSPDENCERARTRAVRAVADPLLPRIVRAALDAIPQLRDAPPPEVPSCLHDRACDAWEPLIAIADLAGGDWPARAREAAVALSGSSDEESEPLGVRLLADLRTLYDREAVDRLPTDRIVEVLVRDPEAPWGDLGHGEKLTPRRLARLLRPFGVRPKTLRTPDLRAKGYYRDDFCDAWTRYLDPPPRVQSVTPCQASNDAAKRDFENVTPRIIVTDGKIENPASNSLCHGVTDPIGVPDDDVLEIEVADDGP